MIDTPRYDAMPVREFCGVPFVSSTPEEASEWICAAATSGVVGHVHLLNAYSIVVANKSRDFANAVVRGATNFPDGKPVAALSGLGVKKLHQVRGPALFESSFDKGQAYGVKHFLLGGSPETLSRLKFELMRRYPRAQIVGAESPPFRAMSIAEQAAQDLRIRQSGAHVVWVGLGTPKQDIEAARIAGEVRSLIVAVGAAFDFSAGTKKVAPRWFERIGLEWLYRFLQEPRRLWRRYLIGNFQFLILVAQYRLGLRRHNA